MELNGEPVNIKMRKNIKLKDWDMISAGDRSYLYSAYERYKKLWLSPYCKQSKRDDFHKWLLKRGIQKQFNDEQDSIH